MKLFAQAFDSSEFTTTELTTTDLTTTSPGAESAAGIGLGLLFLYIAVLAFILACNAKIYVKAGRQWWEAIVPIYNIYVLQKIVGRPGWWVLLYFIPFVNFIVVIVNGIDLAKAFGKGVGTGLAYVFLPIIMAPIMAFSSSYQYKKGSSSSNMGSGPTDSPSKSQGFEGQAVTSVPTAGAAVGGGVGAAQPGEAISQTNPVPKDGPVNSPADTPETPASEPQKPEEPASESLEQPSSGTVEQPSEAPQPEQPETPSGEQTAPDEPTSPPENPPAEDPNDPQNPGAGTTLG